MPIYVDRETPKLWRRICTEATIEISLLLEIWKLILAGFVLQYIHGLAAHGVHYLHRSGPTLQDAGFFILPVEDSFLSILCVKPLDELLLKVSASPHSIQLSFLVQIIIAVKAQSSPCCPIQRMHSSVVN